jgi:hypothetical protein
MDSIIYQIVSYVFAFITIMDYVGMVLKYRKSRKQIDNARTIRIAPINRILFFFSGMVLYQTGIVICAFINMHTTLIFESLWLFWLMEIGLGFWAVVSDDAAILKGVYFSIEQLNECCSVRKVRKKSIKVSLWDKRMVETYNIDKERLFFTPHGL